MKFIRLMILLSVIAVSALTAYAQEGSNSMFKMLPDPIFERGDPISWDDTFNEPGATIFYDGQFHMLRNGVSKWPSPGATAYLTSEDGLNWTVAKAGPFFATSEVPYVEVSKHNYSVLVEDDGTWVIYFFAYQDSGIVNHRIGRATAPSPDGPWTPNEDFVLTVGSDGEWDSAGVSAPYVVKAEDGTYLMFYSGRDGGTSRIGLATSEDGVSWTKYDDPATTDAPYAESDPVFVGEQSDNNRWEFRHVNWPHVVVGKDGRYELFYRGGDGSIGLAVSDDGINWTRYPNNPVMDVKDVVTETNIGSFSIQYHDETYYLYMESRVPQGGTKVYVATYAGEFAIE